QHRRMFQLDVHGGSLAFHRRLFERGERFPDVSLAEDAHFLTKAVGSGARLLPLPADDLYVYIRHGTNTWRFGMRDAHGETAWFRCETPASVADDLDFYAPFAATALQSA